MAGKKQTIREKKKELRDAGVRYLSNSRGPEVRKYYKAFKKRENEEDIGAELSKNIKTLRRMDKRIIHAKNRVQASRNQMEANDDLFADIYFKATGAKKNEFVCGFRVVYTYKVGDLTKHGSEVLYRTIKTYANRVPAWKIAKTREEITDTVENRKISGDIESVVSITLEGARLIDNDAVFDDIEMHGEKIGYSFLKKVNKYVKDEFTNQNCVLAMIMDQLQGKPGFVKLTFPMLTKQFMDIGCDVVNGVSVNHLMNWVREFHPKTISVFCISPRMIVSSKYVPEDQDHHNGAHHTLTLIVNNNHCYPITNEKLASFVSKSKRIDVNEIEQFKYTACDYKYVPRMLPCDVDIPDEVNELDFGIDVVDDLDCGMDDDSAEKDVVTYTTEQIETMVKDYSDLIDGTLEGQVFIVDDVFTVFQDIRKKHNLISNNRRSGGKMTAFLHPISNQIIESGALYQDRKEICERLYEKYNCSEFSFTNQSFTRMATDLFKIKVGTQPRLSFNSDEDIRIYDSFPTIPLIGTLVEDYEFHPDTCFAVDHKSSYPNAVLNMRDDYPVFAEVDSWQPMREYNYMNKDGKRIVVCGEYLINSITIKKLGGIHIQKQVIGHNMMKYLLRKKLIRIKDVLLFRKASYSIDHKVIADFMKEMMDVISRDEFGDSAKRLVNCFIGSFGRRFNTHDNGFITDSWEMVCAMFNQNKEGFSMSSHDGLFFCGNTVKTRLRRENCSIFRQILCQGQMQVLEMIGQYVGPKSTLIGYNTDSIYVQHPSTTVLEKLHRELKDFSPRLYKPFEPNTLPHDIEPIRDWRQLEDVQFDGDLIRVGGKVATDLSYLEKLKNMSFCCTGEGGVQKSTLMAKLYDAKDTIMVSLSAKVADNAKKNGMENAKTLKSQFYKLLEVPKHVKLIQIDEYGMVPCYYFGVLYELKKRGIHIQMYGDPNQIAPVKDRFFELEKKKLFRMLCDNNLMEKQYIEQCARYDTALKAVLEEFLETGYLPQCLKDQPIDDLLELNIVTSHLKRKAINAKFATDFKVGGLAFCWKNMMNKRVINGSDYIVREVHPNHLAISELDGTPIVDKNGKDLLFLKENFYLPYAATVNRYQGSTVREPFNIHQSDLMDRNKMYTALSRATCLKDIHIEWTSKRFYPATEKVKPDALKHDVARVGFIYEMYNAKHDLYYVGLSTVSVEERFKGHKNDKNDKMHQHDGEWTVKTICSVFYQDEEFLRSIETRWIHHYMITGHEVTNDRQRIKDIKYEMQGPTIAIEKKRFQITEGKDCFRIQWRDADGKKKEKQVRFGKRKSKEEARVVIERARNDLLVVNFE